MQVALFANNWLGWQIAQELRSAGEVIRPLVLHPPDRRRHGDAIIAAAGTEREWIMDASALDTPAGIARLRDAGAELGVSALFGYRLGTDVLTAFPNGCINVHPSLLPWNRGAYPNVWSIVDHTPAGATIHVMDERLDTGPILRQRQVAVYATDTGYSLYWRTAHAALELFADVWPAIREGRVRPLPQPPGGSSHRLRDVEAVDEIDLERRYTARELIDLLRARTFPPHAGAYFRAGGRRIYLRLELEEEEGSALWTDLDQAELAERAAGGHE